MNGNKAIPQLIHYCWFGRNPLPPLAVKCINSWKKILQGFEIIEWNEDNFDLVYNQYVKQAYESKKWAFVSDYVRLRVLYDFGGIYMDTDIEVLKELDEFLNLPAFSGFEGNGRIPTGIIGAMKGNKWIKELLNDYDERIFIKEDGSYDLTPNVDIITYITKKMYLINLDNTLLSLSDVSLYPFDWFCAKSIETGKIKKSENTYTIHHFSGSWMPLSKKIKIKLMHIIGIDRMKKLTFIKQFILRRIKR